MTYTFDPTRSAAEDLDAHLLGRKPLPKDDRDWSVPKLLAAQQTAAEAFAKDATVQQLIDSGAITTWAEILDFWRWLKGEFGPTPPKPQPTPPTPAPPTPVPVIASGTLWADPHAVLDQGQTPHCVGNAWAQWGNTSPVNDNLSEQDAAAIYYACKVLDGEPGAEDGSNTRSGVKVMQQRGRVANYAFASTVQEVTDWLTGHGPVVVGTDWLQDMFRPTSTGYLPLSGRVAGGHEYLLEGYCPEGAPLPILGTPAPTPTIVVLNSWGSTWAVGGRAYIAVQDFAKLLAQGGDACCATELPVAA